MPFAPLQLLLDFLFPPRCPICRAYIPASGTLCAPCLAKAIRPHRPALPPALAALVTDAWTVGPYHEGLRPMIRALKYQGRRAVVPAFGTLLAAARIPAGGSGIAFAVPVPLYAAREKARGFNQTEEIFRAYLKGRAIPIRRALVRTHETPPLYDLSPREREAVLKNAFAHDAKIPVTGRHVLLLDDVLTTGATLAACARVLKQAGAARIDVLVLASDRA